MKKPQPARLLTTSALALAASMPETTIRQLEARGIIVAQRDSNNRRLFAPNAIETLRAYKAARSA